MTVPRFQPKVEFLPAEIRTLSDGIPPAQPGTLFVLGARGGMRVAPDAGFTLVFGRQEDSVHVCVGPGDTHVSRRHGHITRENSRWILHNTGKLAIRFPGSRLVLRGQAAELPAAGYTPLFIVAPDQDHLFEVRIASGAAPLGAGARNEAPTEERRPWRLEPSEHLVLVCLSQRYLRHDPDPQPLTWAQVADELGRLQPKAGWNQKKAARRVEKVRHQLSGEVPGLLEHEVAPPIGNALNVNLIRNLLITGTITPDHLSLLDEPPER
ncbi:hypothetical protein ACQPZP_41825 [Spirillospora sp. CA-142024]|uniref:hypothetical protein n=1 Tax=Spirillospora sp. CA-142024 TaxID=3240036 RepID=UPI003D90112B